MTKINGCLNLTEFYFLNSDMTRNMNVDEVNHFENFGINSSILLGVKTRKVNSKRV